MTLLTEGGRGLAARSGGRASAGSSAAILLAAALLAACSTGQARERELAHSRASKEALAQVVVDGLGAKDREGLEALLVTREEHRTYLWEALPERRYLGFEYVRFLNEHDTRKALDRALERFGGKALRFLRLEFTEEPETYPEFTLHRGARLWVRDRNTGDEGYLPILDVVLERRGEWKLMHYEE